ncbi:DUF1275 family protein [Belnapia sp. T6]|uniref:DUF1275 family protein n=1 Tax=Belnapia mucosa TaxID=2804532 RepID=A0ABS1VA31_9PROT|nr:DUF1275 family protein [Belnapia mucosa]MBL6457193.1 DUF1275 family protein [Belnapia mucosa]
MAVDGALRRAWMAVPLVAIGGCVDAIGWLRLRELFVSFMSGTSTLLGLALAEGQPDRAAELGLVVLLFAGGAVAGAGLARLAGAWRAPVVLGVVAALLACAWRLSWIGGAGLPPMAFAMVPAMGALNMALPGVGGITFVTGALTRFADALITALAGAGRHGAWMVQIAAWMALVAGATAGAWLETRMGQDALVVPALAAALAAAGLAAAGWPQSGRAQ